MELPMEPGAGADAHLNKLQHQRDEHGADDAVVVGGSVREHVLGDGQNAVLIVLEVEN